MSLNILWTFIAEADQPPTTAEIAAALGISTSAARRRLKKLREADRVESLKVGKVITWRAVRYYSRDPGEADARIMRVVGEPATGQKITYTYLDEVDSPPDWADLTEPSQIPAGSVLPGSGDNQKDRATGTRSPVSSPAAPDPITIKLSGFAAFEVPADGAWKTFAEFQGYREAERVRYRIASLGWTPPGKGSKQVEIRKVRVPGAFVTGTVYQVRVRAMPARKPPSKAGA